MKTARTAGWVFLSIALLTAQSSLALTVIGQVETLEGFASATDRDGKPRKLGEGRAIFEGDRVQTADNSTVSLTFKDGTVTNLFMGSPIARTSSAQKSSKAPFDSSVVWSRKRAKTR